MHTWRVVRQCRQHARAGLDQNDLRGARIDPAEVDRDRVARDLRDRACHLDAGRAGADDDEREQAGALGLVVRQLRALEGEQNAAADARGVFDALQARRELRPFVMAEIRMRGAGRDDELIVGDRGGGRLDLPIGGVDAGDFRHQHGGIALVAQDGADRPGDLGGRERRGRHLIEQRLEAVMVLPVDHRDVDRDAGERRGGREAAEAGADDDDVRTLL